MLRYTVVLACLESITGCTSNKYCPFDETALPFHIPFLDHDSSTTNDSHEVIHCRYEQLRPMTFPVVHTKQSIHESTAAVAAYSIKPVSMCALRACVRAHGVVRSAAIMSDEALTNEQVAEMRKKRTFRKFTFRGVDLDKLLDLSMDVRIICPPSVVSRVRAALMPS